jgi:hypothetical protein
MPTKIFGERAALPPGNWRRLNGGMSIEVAGVWHRKPDVQHFIREAEAAGQGHFGVVARREPENPHGRGNAIAVDGWWIKKGFFGGEKTERVHLGYVPAWASSEAIEGKQPEPAIFVDLYSAYLGHDGFVDVDIIVHVERTAAEQAEREAERESKRRAREMRNGVLRGLRVLARIAAADGHRGPEEERVMRAYIASRYVKAGMGTPLELIDDLMSSAIGSAPTDQAASAAVRAIAEDDDALSDLFNAMLALARADGSEDEGEIAAIRKVIAAVRRRREKAANTS